MPDPDRRRVQLPFGQGLQRETGVMAVRQGSMEDLRNVYLRRAKVQLRRGNEERLALTDENGIAITHVLAGQEVRGKRIGLIVGYQGDDTAAAHGAVYIYRIDANANVSSRLGKWFDQTNPAENDPPTVTTAENFGTVLFAHDTFRRADRATTLIYNATSGAVLEDLDADFAGDSGIAFRGVASYLDYMIGWGYGDANKNRPELLRISRPGDPDQFRPNDYFIVGSRGDPVVSGEPSGDRFIVLKEAETFALTGTSPANFGLFPVDNRFGCLAPRLSLSVQGTVFFWSAEGPRATTGGVSQQISIPLELEAPEPSDLVAKTDFEKGFASYIPEEQIAIWVFGKRVYAFNLRGEKRGWAYWELGFEPESGFSLYAADRGAAAATVPAGAPEWTENDLERVEDGQLIPVWDNENQAGDEFVEIWGRPSTNLLGAEWRFRDDTDGDGVANGWTSSTDSPITSTFSFLFNPDGTGHAAQQIEVSGATGEGVAEVYRSFTTDVEAGKDYTVGVELLGSSLAGAVARLQIEWRDNTGTVLSTVTSPEWNPTAEFVRRVIYDETAPANTDEIRIRFQVYSAASGDTGTFQFRLAGAYKVENQGDWRRLDSVEVSTQTAQQETITDLPIGQFYQTAVRYRRGAVVTAGYEGSDADAWPDKSKGVAVAGTGSTAGGSGLSWHTFDPSRPGPAEKTITCTADGVVWFRTLETTEFIRGKWAVTEALYDRLQESDAAGEAAGLRVYRRASGASTWNFLVDVPVTQNSTHKIDGDHRILTYDDGSVSGETEYEYTAAAFFGSEETAKLDAKTIWVGPPKPSAFQAFRNSDGHIVVEWNDAFCTSVSSNTTVIETKNITQGEASFTQAGEVDEGTQRFVDALPKSDDEVEVRIRHETDSFGVLDFSPWTTVETVTSSQGGSGPTDLEDVAGMGWGFFTNQNGDRLSGLEWQPSGFNEERAASALTFTDELHDRMEQAAQDGKTVGHAIYRRLAGDSTWTHVRDRTLSAATFPMSRNADGVYQEEWLENHTSGEAEWEYTHAPIIGGTEGAQLALRSVWLGPPEPKETRDVYPGASTGDIVIEWRNGFFDLLENLQEDESWRTEVQTKNITDGESSFTDAAGSPVDYGANPNNELTITGLTGGDEIEARIRHASTYFGDDDFSQWVNLGTVVAPS